MIVAFTEHFTQQKQSTSLIGTYITFTKIHHILGHKTSQ